jgi:hypothetical protein
VVCGLLFYGLLNDGFKGLASDVVVLRVEYPGADWGRLISQRVEDFGGDNDFPDGLFGLFAKSVAAFVECCFYGSNVCGDSECFRRFGFFHWYSSYMEMTAIAQQALGALGNCFFCFGETQTF